VFATSVAAMFGMSALYHRVTWSTRVRPWIRRLDHATLFGLIAGSYTAFGLLALPTGWRWSVLPLIWTGVAVAITLKFVWVRAPKWVAAGIAIGLGWVSVVTLPILARQLGPAGTLLVLAGGLLYTAGGIVYARRRPDPYPAVFGYHEVFHALVVVAVALQYAAAAFFLPWR
jgi:hemolysin III